MWTWYAVEKNKRKEIYENKENQTNQTISVLDRSDW